MASARKRGWLFGGGTNTRTVYAERLIFVDEFEVFVREKAVRRISLHVKAPDGRIEVSAPRFTPDFEIAQLVRSHRAWIAERRHEIASSPMAQAEAATPEQVKEWHKVVKACVPPLIEAWEPILSVKAGKLAYRNMKTRWGSCQPSTGRICINVRLALYPPECLEYVVVHELCHLIVPGHGPAFQRILTQVMPDWRVRRAKLKQ